MIGGEFLIHRTCSGISLRLGHVSALTVHRTVIHYQTPLRYPERAKELFAKAEETAKAKYERLKKLVEFYNV